MLVSGFQGFGVSGVLVLGVWLWGLRGLGFRGFRV